MICLNWHWLCGCIHACLRMCILRSSDSLWGEPVHQVLSEGSGRDGKARGAWADGAGTHVVRLVCGHGLAVLRFGGRNRSSPTAGGQVGTSEPVRRLCGTHIKVRPCSSPCLKCGGHTFGRNDICEIFCMFYSYRWKDTYRPVYFDWQVTRPITDRFPTYLV